LNHLPGNLRVSGLLLRYQRKTILLYFYYSNYFFEENV
jgi:hypothetical protein